MTRHFFLTTLAVVAASGAVSPALAELTYEYLGNPAYPSEGGLFAGTVYAGPPVGDGDQDVNVSLGPTFGMVESTDFLPTADRPTLSFSIEYHNSGRIGGGGFYLSVNGARTSYVDVSPPPGDIDELWIKILATRVNTVAIIDSLEFDGEPIAAGLSARSGSMGVLSFRGDRLDDHFRIDGNVRMWSAGDSPAPGELGFEVFAIGVPEPASAVGAAVALLLGSAGRRRGPV